MLWKAVVSFMLKRNNTYKPVGSGTFVFYDGQLLIVSAAHVFEDLTNNGEVYLYVGPVNHIFLLEKFKIFVSAKEHVSAKRSEDSLDLGVMVVPDRIIEACNGEILMVQEDMIENDENRRNVLFYQAIGYPASKNAKLADKAARTNRLFSPEILIYSGTKKTPDDIDSERYLDKHHVILDWNNKNNFDDNGSRVNVPKPNGISGGLIQGCYDYIPHSNGLYPTCAAGIITERNSSGSAMVGTRFSTVFEWLKLHPRMFT